VVASLRLGRFIGATPPVVGKLRNKRVALLTPDEFTVSNIAHVR
jgi:hypothetical protein